MLVNTGDLFRSIKLRDFTPLQLVYVVSEELIQKENISKAMIYRLFIIFLWQENVLISTHSIGYRKWFQKHA
jgi:hypothetical protein